jgi:hypothetical protein
MDIKMTDVTLHIDENTTKTDRESLRDSLLNLDGVMTADYHDVKPHLMIVGYDPDTINSSNFLSVTKTRGLHAELIGL